MEDKLNRLKERLHEISDLNGAQAVLGWDHQTYMPRGGAEDRGDQLATLAHLAHQRFVSDEMGQLLDAVEPLAAQLDPQSDDACLVRVARREYKRFTRVPARWVGDFARATTIGQSVWEQARAESNFALFRPQLEEIIRLRQEYASFFAPYDHIYDPLLDEFEPGLKTAEVQEIFGRLRESQVALVQAVLEKPEVEDAFIRVPYPEKGQWDFGVEVISRLGYDWTRGRLDKSAHPFSTAFGIGDVRITTRFDPDHSMAALFGTMHECGHALYEQGIDPALRRTPLAGGASMAVHESQSRLWENLVGRSRPFWKHYFKRAQEYFPEHLGNVDLEGFYRAINKVERSLIRVEADEATYNLHIMLRLELEIAMLEGSLEVRDLPEAWNARMQSYLGVLPPNDAKGVLQDIHWAGGMVGYFPTYALGNLISVQLWEKIHQDLPNLEEQIEQGEFSPLREWLREHVHRHGAKFQPQELVLQVTGSRIDPEPYIRYLQAKFGEIYAL
ncbi:MAG: carboxypeptidase M32 [Anaerolineaceae bacterium]|nr:carboxypeptidase M32 [Anaerolineaceae bacterium]